MIAGTAEYMSPEQARGEELDARSDIYSFCVVLYEMAAGREPFSGDTSSVIRYAILHREPRPLRRANPAMPPELERVIARGMEKDRDQRYQTMGELLTELKRVRFYRESAELAEAIPPLPAPPPRPKPQGRGLRGWLALATVALLLAAIAMMWDLRSRTAARMAIQSLAVIPLQSVGADGVDAYLSEGLTEDIAGTLARIRGIGVISRVSAFRLGAGQRSSQEAARLLGAESLLTGRVRARGDTVELQLDLILARDGSMLWSGEYQSRREDLPAVPQQVARAIAESFRFPLSPADSLRLSQPPTASGKAYELYLQGCYLQKTLTPESLGKADEAFLESTKLDEKYALPYLARAELWLEAQDREYVSTADAQAKVQPVVERVLELDPGLPRAHLALANLKYRLAWDWSSAGDEFHQAVMLDPADAAAHRWYSLYLGFLGRYDDSMAEIAQSVRLDPLDPDVHLDRGILLLGNREYARAADELRAALDLDPGSAATHFGLASLSEAKGDCREAAAERIRGLRAAGQKELAEAARNGLEAAGCHGAAQKALDVLLRSPELQNLRPVLVAGEYARVGDREKALDWLERAFRLRAAALLNLRGDPQFDSLRADPRFQNLLRRLKPPE
jgi:TolB-like protein